jgi:hypothetical protein
VRLGGFEAPLFQLPPLIPETRRLSGCGAVHDLCSPMCAAARR